MKLLFAAIVFVSVALGVSGQDEAFASRDLWVDNCGLNVCAFVARWFDCFVDPYGMLGELGIGSHSEQPASLLSLKKALEARNLEVNAYKQAKLDEMLTGLDGGHICVFHVNVEGAGAGHFYVVVAASKTHVLLVDAAKEFGWVPVSRFKEEFTDFFSGFYLNISPADRNTEATAVRKPPVASSTNEVRVSNSGRDSTRVAAQKVKQ